MKPQLLLSLALLPQTAVVMAFQTTMSPITAITTTQSHDAPMIMATCLHMSNNGEEIDSNNKRLLPPTTTTHHQHHQQQQPPKRRNNNRRRKLSKLTIRPLSALTTLKKDERIKFNQRRLLQLGITTTAASILSALTHSPIARAATPLLVTSNGHITPLISSYAHSASEYGSLVTMPGMRGISPAQVGQLPLQVMMMFGLSLFFVMGALRSAEGGYVRLMTFMAKSMKRMFDKNDTTEEEEKMEMVEELGLPKEVDWNTYSHSELDPILQSKHPNVQSELAFNPQTLLFERSTKKKNTKMESSTREDAVEDTKVRQATRFFQEQKYRQHHHPVHVAHSKYEKASYLDTLAINEMIANDDNVPRGYLDTLNAKASTWDVYKHQLEDVHPVNEVDELKEEVSTLQSLMQIEQSMYQTSNAALKLAMEAQTEELHQSSNNNELKEFDRKLSTQEELREFDRKSQEYEETVGEDAKKMSLKTVEEEEKSTL